jgi:hypothetical protein
MENENSFKRAAIRLDDLNEDVRKKVSKFDVNNDGELSMEEALQSIVTLQKQSNNYKKMVYMLVPILLVTLVGVLGINVLAIQLTKDLHSNYLNNNAVMINRDQRVVRTASYNDFGNLFDAISVLTVEDLADIKELTFGSLVLPITSSQLNENSVTFSSFIVYFTLRQDATFDLNFMPNMNVTTNSFTQDIYSRVESSLLELQSSAVKTVLANILIPKSTRGGPGVVCRTNCRTPR